jgi:hypothetical protein
MCSSCSTAVLNHAQSDGLELSADGNGWPRNVRKHSGYNIDDSVCATYLVNLRSAEAARFRALHNKFRRPQLSGVATRPVISSPSTATCALPLGPLKAAKAATYTIS